MTVAKNSSVHVGSRAKKGSQAVFRPKGRSRWVDRWPPSPPSQDAGRVRVSWCYRLGNPPVGVIGEEPPLAFRTIRRQPEVEERLLHRVVPGPDLHDLARLVGRRHLAAELLAELHRPLDLLHRVPALPPSVPEVVLVSDPHVRAEDERQVLDRD